LRRASELPAKLVSKGRHAKSQERRDRAGRAATEKRAQLVKDMAEVKQRKEEQEENENEALFASNDRL
jgi:hypothetical protein